MADNKPKITIIDDEKDLVGVIKDFLEARNFIVSCAYDGAEGFEVVKKENPDVIVLDITMPVMDGRDVLAKLKKDETTKNIPVIMLSAKDEQFSRSDSMALGAYEYLTKPYRGFVLLRQITNILEKKKKGEL